MKHSIIFSGQTGFRTNHSTEHAFLLISDKLHRELLKVIIFLDNSKAFDAVDHNVLLAKLYLYGIRDVVLFMIGLSLISLIVIIMRILSVTRLVSSSRYVTVIVNFLLLGLLFLVQFGIKVLFFVRVNQSFSCKYLSHMLYFKI